MRRKVPHRWKHITKKSKAKRVFRPHVKVESENAWPFPRKVQGPNAGVQRK